MRATTAASLLALALLTVPSALGGPFGPHGGGANLAFLEHGWAADHVTDGLQFPVSLAFRGDELLVLSSGRYVYAESYMGQDLGRLDGFTLSDTGHILANRTIARGLADPLGMAVAPNGDVYVTQYKRVSRIPASAFDGGGDPTPIDVSWGYPDTETDAPFAPVTGTYLGAVGGIDPLAGDTTGGMGMTFGPDGQLYVLNAAHGRPPDDDGLRLVTGLDYDNPYSSSLIAPTGGALTPDQVAARACRNCFDLAFAPLGSPFAGQLFVTENVGPYRLRAFAGSDRSVLAGSTPTDQNVLDGIDVVDFATHHFRRAATLRPDGAILGSSPTGIAFAPADFGRHGRGMFVTLFSGFTPPTDDRGELAIVDPDPAMGLGHATPFLLGLDFPTDLAFGPDDALYVVEFYNGALWRVHAAA